MRRFNMRSETKSSVVRNSKPITWGFACRPDIRCYMHRDSASWPSRLSSYRRRESYSAKFECRANRTFEQEQPTQPGELVEMKPCYLQ